MGVPQSYEEFTSSTECSFPLVEGDIVHAPKDCAGFLLTSHQYIDSGSDFP